MVAAVCKMPIVALPICAVWVERAYLSPQLINYTLYIIFYISAGCSCNYLALIHNCSLVVQCESVSVCIQPWLIYLPVIFETWVSVSDSELVFNRTLKNLVWKHLHFLIWAGLRKVHSSSSLMQSPFSSYYLSLSALLFLSNYWLLISVNPAFEFKEH